MNKSVNHFTLSKCITSASIIEKMAFPHAQIIKFQTWGNLIIFDIVDNVSVKRHAKIARSSRDIKNFPLVAAEYPTLPTKG